MDLLSAHAFAYTAMETHGLFYSGWEFQWDNAKRRFGRCNYTHKTISLSKHLTLLNTDEEVKDTILHEIAHALVGPKQKHNYNWQMKARQIGAKPEACYSGSVKTPNPKFIGMCLGCRTEINRFRLTRRVKEECYHTVCRRAGKECRIEWRAL